MSQSKVPPAWGNEVQMLAAVRHHATAARAKVASGDRFERMDAVVHAGSAVELLCKLLLLKKHRLLLHSATTWTILASVDPAHPIATEKRSVDVGQALSVVEALHPRLAFYRGDAKTVTERRNDIVHMAIEDPNPIATVGCMEVFAAACLPLLGEDPADLFGVARAQQLNRDTQRRASQIKTNADRLISEAHKGYKTATDGLDGDKRDALERFLVGLNGTSHYDDGWSVECPACKYEGAWLAQEAEVEQDFDGTFCSGMRILGLDCPRCRLSLDELQLAAIDFDTNDYRESEDYYDPRED